MSALSAFLSSEIVSLNHVWAPNSPLNPLNPPYAISAASTHNATFGNIPGAEELSASAVVMQFSGQHGAPTIDALGHIAFNGKLFGGKDAFVSDGPQGLVDMDITEYPESKYINRGVLIDIPFCQDLDILPENYTVTDSDIEDCAKMEGVDIQEGDSVLIRTGYGSLFASDPVAYLSNYPGPSGSAAEYLASKNIFLTGCDNLSWDKANTPFPGHAILIPMNGIYIAENLNLEELSVQCADKGTYEFALVINPAKIKGAAAFALNSFAVFPTGEGCKSGASLGGKLFIGALVAVFSFLGAW